MIGPISRSAIATSGAIDLCIVGAGTAGLALAAEFLDSPWQVVVLESGLESADETGDAQNAAEVVGVRHDGARDGRVRALGGTSTAWGGQSMRLRASELEARPWVPFSGWPLQAAQLEDGYRRAEALLGVPGPPYDDAAGVAPRLAALPLDTARFELRFSQWAALGRRNLHLSLRTRLAAARNVHVLIDATVVSIDAGREGRVVDGLAVRSRDGVQRTVQARHVVLCCGGLEAPRLLLASRRHDAAGVANGSGLVGRFFQDHVSWQAAEIQARDRRELAALFDPRYRGRTMFTAKIEPTDSLQRRDELLNVMGHLAFEIPSALGMLEARRLLRELQRGRLPVPAMDEFVALLRGSATLARMLVARLLEARRVSPGDGRVLLLVDVEQAPDPDSRIRLSRRVDAWGEPLAAVDWRVGDRERRTLARFTRLLGQEFERLGLGALRVADSPDFDARDRLGAARDIFHHLGTTRMSREPASGVVDTDLRCHDVRNLWIAGGAVFPAGGIANPTLTILALALRLADRLKAELHADATGRSTRGESLLFRAVATSPPEPRPGPALPVARSAPR